MRIIIVGCGKVGSELAGQLSAAGHDLTLIDLSERRLDELSNTYDLATVKGSGTSYHVLREAGVQDTDLLIAVTAHDEINLLSCLIARKASGCHAIARVRDPEYVSDLGLLSSLILTVLFNKFTVLFFFRNVIVSSFVIGSKSIS